MNEATISQESEKRSQMPVQKEPSMKDTKRRKKTDKEEI